jgi:hypothetical protein
LQLRSWFEITAYRPSSEITVHRLHRQSFVTTAHRLQRPPWWCATIVYPLFGCAGSSGQPSGPTQWGRTVAYLTLDFQPATRDAAEMLKVTWANGDVAFLFRKAIEEPRTKPDAC